MDCEKDVEKEIEEYRKKKMRDYYEKNKERILQQQKEYRKNKTTPDKTSYERHKRWKEKHKEKWLEIQHNYGRRTRATRSIMGLCTRCGKEDERTLSGYKWCIDCIIKDRKRKGVKTDLPLIRPKKQIELSRSERASYGLCYICGQPVKDGFKLCESHYNDCAQRLKKAREVCREKYKKGLHPWQQQNKLLFSPKAKSE